MSDPQEGWLRYWNELPPGGLLFTPESKEFVRNLIAAFPPQPHWRVLDFGCGYGSVTAGLAPLVHECLFWDASETMRRTATRELRRFTNTRLIDLSSPDASKGLTFDLIVVNSVIQYMTPQELAGWLDRWRRMLTAGGRLVISDVIPPRHGMVADMWALFWFSLRHGYLLAAVRNIIGERLRYQQTAAVHPLQRLSREQLQQEAEAAGLRVNFLDRNLTHFPSRITAAFSEIAPVPVEVAQ